MSREEIVKKGKYYTIIQGSFVTQVPQDHPDAVRRDWKSADGSKSGTKYERVVNALFGFIKDISFHDGDYGMQIYIKLDENEEGEEPIIALPTASREGEDFMKKLPNIDLAKEVRLRPFNFKGNEGDEVRGMEIMQPDTEDKFKVKITNFFQTSVKQADDSIKRDYLNGYPKPEGTDLSKDEWKLYFMQARLFLIKYTKEHIVPKFTGGELTEEQKAIKEFDEIPEKQEKPEFLKRRERSQEEIDAGINIDETPF